MLYEDMLRAAVAESDLHKLGVTARFRRAENAFFLIIKKSDLSALEPFEQIVAADEIRKIMMRLRGKGVNVFLERDG